MFENIKKGIVNVCNGDLYVKDRSQIRPLLARLREAGYKIKDCRRPRRTSLEEMKQNGHSMWFASLQDYRRGKCGSCNELIKVRGIRSHGHLCEACREVTYYEIIDGTPVRFQFISRENKHGGMTDVKLIAKHWDIENGFLYCYPTTLKGLWSSEKTGQQYLDTHWDKWERTNHETIEVIKIPHERQFNRNTAIIEMMDIGPGMSNHSIVKIFNNKEYGEWDKLPIPESINIYEAWHWAPLEPTPYLHEKIISAAGMVSRQDYYYQDGRPEFHDVHFERMSKFVEHFTTLDFKKWQEESIRFRKDGPGCIEDIAAFCDSRAIVRNEPNAGNALASFINGVTNGYSTDRELAAMADLKHDSEQMALFTAATSGN